MQEEPFHRVVKRYHQINNEVRTLAALAGRPSDSVTVVAVSKGRSEEEISALYMAGCRDFGENRVQKLLERHSHFPDDIRWHFIGRIQSNKVRALVQTRAFLHSVDSEPLAELLSQEALHQQCTIEILFQVNLSGEARKQGWTREALLLAWPRLSLLPAIKILGLMIMAPESAPEELLKDLFSELKELQDHLNRERGVSRIREEREPLSELSMGMSNDYPLAVESGATLLRIGRKIFQ